MHEALALDGRQGFVCGDIGCYSLAAVSPANGYDTMKTIHSMGSGTGLASGFGKLGPFGLDQPVLAVCGDSTFYHAAIPALINAVHHRANMILVVLDNGGTAMTGFQSHPGLCINAMNEDVPGVNLEAVCRALGAHVEVQDPFDLEGRTKDPEPIDQGSQGRQCPDHETALCPLSGEERKTTLCRLGPGGSLPRGGMRMQSPLHADPPLSRPGVGQGEKEGGCG